MSWENWILDATMGWPPCFCPIEGDIHGEFSIITGMNLLAEIPPGKLVAIIHADGNEAVEAFCKKHEHDLQEMKAAIQRRDDPITRKERDVLAKKPTKKPAKKSKKRK